MRVTPMSATPELAAQRLVESLLAQIPDADIVARVEHTEDALTRFADSAIHQNHAEDAWTAMVTAHVSGRTLSLSAGLSRADDGGSLDALAARLAASLPLAPADPRWPGAAGPHAVVSSPPAAGSTPSERADAIAAFIDGAGGLSTAGYTMTRRTRRAVATSAGQIAVGISHGSMLDGIARSDGIDGTARGAAHALADLDAHAAGALAAAKVRAGTDAVELPPGRYEVILEPAAAANIVSTLALYGYNGRALLDGSSFVQLGAQQLDHAITIVDDAPAWGVVVDSEGTPTARRTFVEEGRSVAVAHDRRTAGETGQPSTGHAVGLPVPMAIHLGIEPGKGDVAIEPVGPVAASTVPLLAGVERALLISDFWYTRVLDPRQVTMTGLTRNGVWLVENGEIVRPVQNVRFTQSYPGALAPGQVLGVGAVAVTAPDSWNPTAVATPALHLASWNVTGNASG